MLRRWRTILVFSLFLLFFRAWIRENQSLILEELPHGEHEFFAVQIERQLDRWQEVECWKNPYEEGYYLFLPACAHPEDSLLCLNPGERLVLGGEEFTDGAPIEQLNLNQEYMFALFHEDGTRTEGMVTVMQSAGIPALFVDTESGSMDAVHQDKTYREKGNYCLFSPDGREQMKGDLKYITGRGNSTWEWGKKPYRIKLMEAKDFLGMGTGESWELLANFYDNAYIRNKIVYDLAGDMGMKYSPESEFVDLYLNGYYAGVYQLTEKIEVDRERVDITDLAEENKRLNDSVEAYTPFAEENERGVLLGKEPQDITGGYLLEWDVDLRYESVTSSFKTDRGQTVLIKEPGEASRKEVAYIRQAVQEFEDALYAEDGINPDTGKSLAEYIDLESWAKKYLIEELSKNFDGGFSSQYFYKDSDAKGDFRFYAGPVWDYDGSLGNGDWSVRKPKGMLVRYDMHIYDPADEENVFRNRWFPELYRHEEFLDEVELQFESCMWPALYEMLESGIDEYYETIGTAVEMDKRRWHGEPGSYQMVYRETLEEHADYLKEFLRERAAFLKTVWLDKVDYCTVCFRTEYGTRNFFFSVERGGLLEEVPGYEESFAGMVFDGWYYDEAHTEPFDVQRVITEDTDIYAKWVPEG